MYIKLISAAAISTTLALLPASARESLSGAAPARPSAMIVLADNDSGPTTKNGQAERERGLPNTGSTAQDDHTPQNVRAPVRVVPQPSTRTGKDTIDRDGGDDEKGELPGKGATSPASNGSQTR